jgi:hypothetical protein
MQERSLKRKRRWGKLTISPSLTICLSSDPAAKQLLIHLNKKRAEAGYEQFILADRESRSVNSSDISMSYPYVGQPVDAEYLMVKGSIMEEVEREFQAQVSFRICCCLVEITDDLHHSSRSLHSDTPTKRKSRKASLHKQFNTGNIAATIMTFYDINDVTT